MEDSIDPLKKWLISKKAYLTAETLGQPETKNAVVTDS
jgi:hypothetical protein